MQYVTRFAPSPTGPLHLGHAYSALTAFDRALAQGGRFHLRIDDGDATRCRPEWEALIYADLRWLGLTWADPVHHVTARGDIYGAALSRLEALDLLYPCGCSRRDIQNALCAPQEGAPVDPAMGPDGLIYPGTCAARPMSAASEGDAIRLNMARAVAHVGDVSTLTWMETGPFGTGQQRLDADQLISGVGDIVLSRRDMGSAAYHLTVVLDDAALGVTEAVRGKDLTEATQIHRLLQALLDLPTPNYYHHDLIRDESGKRLAKRPDPKAISKFRDEGLSPSEVRAMVGL